MGFARASRRWWVPTGVAAAIAVVLAFVTYGVMAANTVPASKAGDGSGAVTGYTVSAVDYTLNATNPQNIDQVAFTLDSTPPAGSNIKVKLVSAGTTWYSCSFAGASVACATTSPQATVASADQLTVVAAN